MFLGLDISTSIIGWSIVDKKGNLVDFGNIVFPKKLGTNLLAKMDFFVESFTKNVKQYFDDIEFWAVEEAVKKFQGGKSTANTIYVCASFNFGVTYKVYSLLGKEPTYIAVTTARKSVGIKVPRGLDKYHKKAHIVDWCKGRYKNFITDLTRTGRYKPYVLDMADSIVITESLRLLNE